MITLGFHGTISSNLKTVSQYTYKGCPLVDNYPVVDVGNHLDTDKIYLF